MATQEEYKNRLLPLLTEAFAPQPETSFAPAADESVAYESTLKRAEADQPSRSLSAEELLVLSEQTAVILEELERQNQAAGRIMRAMMPQDRTKKKADGDLMAAPEAAPPVLGHSKKGVLLHHLHNPPEPLMKELDEDQRLKSLWMAAQKAAAPSVLDTDAFKSVAWSAAPSAGIFCNEWGDIYGHGKYEMLDIGWASVLKNSFMNLLPKWFGSGYGIADFVRHDAWQNRVRLQPGSNSKVRIAIIGDWASGKYQLDGLSNSGGPACAVMETLGKLPQPPDYLVHLGDVYYTGTGSNRSPKNEEKSNLVDVLKLYPNLARPGRCFALNSNHEMYGGAYGYYAALHDALFSSQKGSSYFALEFGDWIIAGIDSAYFTKSPLYMNGGLGRPGKDPQQDFLQQLKAAKAAGKKVILMSHHPALKPDGTKTTDLWDDVSRTFKPDFWYWGHLHLGVVYKTVPSDSTTKCRCIGHSSMPFAIPPEMSNCASTVAWYSQTPLTANTARAKNGFAMLTLSAHGITEEVYEIGNTTPVWRA